MQDQSSASDRVETAIPGRAPIELISFYDEFREYYAHCELQTKRWFVEHIQPDWWIFDVGANIGYYTILFSQLAPNGRVFAFEPTATAAMLRSNLEHNRVRNAEVQEVAVGAVAGEQVDRIYRLWGTEGELKTYAFCRIDDFVADNRIERVDCIKIDVDSFDFDVLRGAEQTLLERDPVVVVELNHALAKRNQSAGEALAWLAERGYETALVLDHDNFVLQRGSKAVMTEPGLSRLQLLFPPPLRIDERMREAAGRALAPSFVKGAQLQNGAAAELSRLPPTQLAQNRLTRIAQAAWQRMIANPGTAASSNLSFADIVGLPIDTSAMQWSYALTLQLDPAPTSDVVTIEVGVEVLKGKLGIAACGEDQSHFIAPERTLAAMPDTQRVLIKAPAKDLRSIIFRNVALPGGKTRFKLVHLQARQQALA